MVDKYVFVSLILGVVCVIALEKGLIKRVASKRIECEDALRRCFGEHMYVTTLAYAEVMNWFSSHQKDIKNDTKALVTKVNSEAFKELGKRVNVDGLDNYLVIAIVSPEKGIVDAILVKYDKLEQKLEELLAKGNGSLVVEE